MDKQQVQDMVQRLKDKAQNDTDIALSDRLALNQYDVGIQQKTIDRLAIIDPPTADIPKTDPKPKAKASPRPKAKVQGQQTPKADMQTAFVNWFVSSFKDTNKVDRANGIVYNGKVGNAHKKVVKTPTFENKGGLFFGAVLNQHLAKVKGLQYHAKSNVYKAGPNTTPATIKAVKKAIVKVVDGYTGPPIK